MLTNPIPIRLKQARKLSGITQKNLGVMIGMDESSASGRMNHYEKGRHTPDISTLKKMADALGVPLNYFFCEDDTSAELACLISKLGDDERKKLIDHILSDRSKDCDSLPKDSFRKASL
ncbi:XRE family transcriptional regulator [Alginatibacterium sediminis]|uniref:XRE family transcriptional regulator n=1 Tax=Alginatibacterium sediminis TaxID=2164068 RepID=A0A420E6V1_9ALTE|nr:helix-turn-helix transcriptional regulator [Alginatibacterium sediminis]RKF14347.1 XRE family transcriptional regulator [Alginatibacterium sediminis]